jgi:NadR type nicotinamide-nucleotide adenylyltransferase
VSEREGARARAAVVTGPECTGKTTLAARLARAFDAPLSGEYARAYYDALLGTDSAAVLGARDVEPIARGQIAAEDAARREADARGRPLVVHDTDLASTVVYARHYYGACPPWIVAAARDRRADLYLLCAPDVPWLPDDVRDRPHARESMLAEFRAVLEELGAHVVDVTGDWQTREATALAVVETTLGVRR